MNLGSGFEFYALSHHEVLFLAGGQRKGARGAALNTRRPQSFWFGGPDQGDPASLLDRHDMVAAMKDNNYRMLILLPHAEDAARGMPNSHAVVCQNGPLKTKGLQPTIAERRMRKGACGEIQVTVSVKWAIFRHCACASECRSVPFTLRKEKLS